MKVFNVFLLLLSVLAGFSAAKEIALQESESAYRELVLQVIPDEDVPEQLKQAVERSVRLPGIMNMTDPNYKFKLDGETYFLWTSEESGAIMNILDTHTVYTIQQKDAEEVYRLLTSIDGSSSQ
ncbi:hypothetical protein HNO89_002062 [Sporosarcina luteola]|nr:hypothetical protein [Sporosarcina luteola]